MNVVKKVANTVRRPAIFRAGITILSVVFTYYCEYSLPAGSGGPPLLADPEREPFLYEIQQQALHYLLPGVQSTTEEKIQGVRIFLHFELHFCIPLLFLSSAVAKIGHMCWTGDI